MTRFKSSAQIFYKKDGTAYQPGELFVQKELAETLKRISKHGAQEFYTGKTADLIVEEMNRHGGFITKEDLKNYTPSIRKPIHGTYRGHDVYSMSPPSSGGIHVVQILNMMEN